MKIEIVHTDAEQPYHARIIGNNGEKVRVTENYTKKFDATHAVLLLAEAFGYRGSNFILDSGVGGRATGLMTYGYEADGTPEGIRFEDVDERKLA